MTFVSLCIFFHCVFVHLAEDAGGHAQTVEEIFASMFDDGKCLTKLEKESEY